MIQLELQPELEAKLTAAAQANGLDVNKYLEKLLAAQVRREPSLEEIAAAVDRIRELRKGNYLGGLKIKDLVNEGRKY